MANNNKKIKRLGIFDSGIGGLSIMHALTHLPIEEFIYVADTANLPYGQKTPAQIQQLSVRLTEFLISQKVDAIVIACHTACTAAFDLLQQQFPDILFIGMIDGTVEYALGHTKNNRIGVIGTQATIDVGTYTQKILAHTSGIRVVERACPQLVPLIENDLSDIQSIKHALKIYLTPLMIREIDTLILGCTHYILVQNLIREMMGQNVTLVNALQPVRRQMKALVQNINPSVNQPDIKFYVTGDKNLFFNPYTTILSNPTQQLQL